MTVKIACRADFSLANYRQVAWQGAGVRFTGHASARMAACRAQFLALIDHDPDVVIYGVTSGYGQHAHLRFTPEERRRHAARPPLAAASPFGAPFPTRVTRGFVFARLANYVEGHAAITPALAQAVAALLDDGAEIPPVPMDGHGGAGEIQALAHLLGPLAQRQPLAEKDALSLINGSPCAAALLADAALAGRRRLELALSLFALSAEAFLAPHDALDTALDGLWGDPAEAEVLDRLRTLLVGGAGHRRPFQAPVSFRIAPRLLARSLRAVVAAERAAEVSLQAVTDNPVFVAADQPGGHGRVLSNGGYHNAMAAPALDELAAAAADLALLAERQAAKLLDGRVSGLPDQLLTTSGDDRYMGTLPMASVGFGEQARHAAQRTFLAGPESGGFGQNDVAANAIPAWRKQAEAGSCLDACLAILAVIASQALHVTGRSAPPDLEPLLDQVRGVLPPVEQAAALGGPLGRIRAWIEARVHTP